jgi:RNA polymerase sigma factor (sigma-70 family)
MSPAQERALARRSAQGDLAARRRLVEANLGLVATVAAEYRGRGVPFADLLQEGSIGLIRAVDRFDHRRGVRLSTYASWWIRNAVVSALGDARTVRLPDSAQRRLQALRRSAADLAVDTGREPTLDQAARAAGLSPADAAQLERATRVRSLDEPFDGGTTLADTVAAVDDGDDPVDAELVRRAVGALPARSRLVIERSFGLDGGRPETLREIAGRIGASPERARQVRAEALRRLRTSLRPAA